MPRSKVKSGDTYLSLGLEGAKRVEKGIRSVSRRLAGIGSGLRTVGTAAVAAGTALVATFVSAARSFASAGDEIDKMSRRTGFSAESLSRLGFAAEQSGQSVGQLESVLIGQSRQIRNLERGLSTAVDGFSDLGLEYSDLRDLDPESQFLLIADRLSQVEDPTRRAGIAMQVFGRSGRNLIPLLSEGSAGIRALTDEADRLGITMTETEAIAGADLTDAMNRVRRQLHAVWLQIGAAVAGPLSGLLNWITTYLAEAIAWSQANQGLLRTVAAVAAGVIAAGAAVVTLGVGFAGAGLTLSGLLALLGAVLSPLGLVTAAVVAGTGYFLAYTEAGQAMVEGLLGYFGELGDIAGETFAGISAAIQNGNLEAATEVLWAGLGVIWIRGTAPLRELWSDLVLAMRMGWRTAGDYLLGAADSLFTTLAVGLNSLLAFFERTWARIKGLFGGDAQAEIDRINDELAASNQILRDAREGRKQGRERARAEAIDGFAGDRNAALDAAEQKLADARQQLADLSTAQQEEAARAAEAAAEKASEGLAAAAGRNDQAQGKLGDSGGVGVFNAAAIASLARIGGPDDAALTTAEATERTAKATEAIANRRPITAGA